MVLAIVFAHLWGVTQLALIGSVARTVRLRTLLLAVATGLYACAPLALLLHHACTAGLALVTGESHDVALATTAYTAGPFIEELVKILPVLALLRIPSVRRQWGVTDCVLLAAACGAGFAVAEDLYRFGSAAGTAYAFDSGWSLATGMALPFVPGFGTALTSWLPAGVAPSDDFFPGTAGRPWVSVHLCWAAIGGLGVGLISLSRPAMLRAVGVALLVVVGIDHASWNATAAGETTSVTLAFAAVRNWLPWLPALALVAAWALDRRRRQPGHEAAMLLAAEAGASSPAVGTVRAAFARLPGSVASVFAFVRLRRAYAMARSAGEADHLRAAVAAARDRLDTELADVHGRRDPVAAFAAPLRAAFSRVSAALRTPRGVLTLVAMLPALLWYVVGGWPQAASLLPAMRGGVTVWLLRLSCVVAAALLARQLLAAGRQWPRVRDAADREGVEVFVLRSGAAVGAAVFLAAALVPSLIGAAPLLPVLTLFIADPLGNANPGSSLLPGLFSAFGGGSGGTVSGGTGGGSSPASTTSGGAGGVAGGGAGGGGTSGSHGGGAPAGVDTRNYIRGPVPDTAEKGAIADAARKLAPDGPRQPVEPEHRDREAERQPDEPSEADYEAAKAKALSELQAAQAEEARLKAGVEAAYREREFHQAEVSVTWRSYEAAREKLRQAEAGLDLAMESGDAQRVLDASAARDRAALAATTAAHEVERARAAFKSVDEAHAELWNEWQAATEAVQRADAALAAIEAQAAAAKARASLPRPKG